MWKAVAVAFTRAVYERKLCLLVPNSHSVGFQSLGGSGASKMHEPQNRNTAGTSLEPRWNLPATLLELCWNLVRPEPCRNLAGTVSGWNIFSEMHVWTSFFFVYCFLLCLLCWIVMLEGWLELSWNALQECPAGILFTKSCRNLSGNHNKACGFC